MVERVDRLRRQRLAERVRALVDAANAYGGRDNITVVLFNTEEVFE